MSADTVSSASITALDTNPVLRPDTGQGAPAEAKIVNDYAAATTGGLVDTTSTYRMVRIPSTAKVKRVRLDTSTLLDSGTHALAVDVGLYYSDAPANGVLDGTSPANTGAVNDNLFADSFVIGAAQQYGTDVTNRGSYSVDKWNQPIWQAAGLSADPGGYFDVVIGIEIAAGTAAAGKFGLEVEYSM